MRSIRESVTEIVENMLGPSISGDGMYREVVNAVVADLEDRERQISDSILLDADTVGVDLDEAEAALRRAGLQVRDPQPAQDSALAQTLDALRVQVEEITEQIKRLSQGQ